jgi:hypothetical protein
MMTSLRMIFPVILWIGMATGSAWANFDLSIAGVNVDANGGSFFVRATPDAGSTSEVVGSFNVNLLFSNFMGGIGALSTDSNPPLTTPSSPIAGTAFQTGLSSTLADRQNIANGDSINLNFLDTSADIIPAGQNLMQVFFTVPGGFNLGSKFDVTITPGAFPTETNVGDVLFPNLTLGSATIAAVPEASSFLLVGTVLAGLGGFRWFKRRRQAAA